MSVWILQDTVERTGFPQHAAEGLGKATSQERVDRGTHIIGRPMVRDPDSVRSRIEDGIAGARVAIIRLRSLGDCVLTTPAISLLRQSRPDLQVGVVVEEAFAPVFAAGPVRPDFTLAS